MIRQKEPNSLAILLAQKCSLSGKLFIYQHQEVVLYSTI